MPFFELFDETLDINSTENYEISVQIGFSGLAYSLIDRLRNKFIMIRSYEPDSGKAFTTVDLEEIFKKDDFLLRKYKAKNIIINSRKFTLVPPSLYDPSKERLFFTFNHINEENTVLINNEIYNPALFILFSLQESLHNIVTLHFPGVQLKHYLVPLFSHIAGSGKASGENYIHLHADIGFFTLIVFENNTLRFCNVFSCKNASDILYHVINVFRQTGIKKEDTLYISGMAERYSDLAPGFLEYVKSIRYAEPHSFCTFSYVFSEADLSRFLNLFTIVA